jgi:hypothetical protein
VYRFLLTPPYGARILSLQLKAKNHCCRRLTKKPRFFYTVSMTAIQQTVEIDASRRVLRLEKPLPNNIHAGRADIVLVLRDDIQGSSPPADDIYAEIPSGLPDDLLHSQIDILEKVEW